MCVAFMPAVNLLAATLIRIDRGHAALTAADEQADDDALTPFLAESAPRLDRLREDTRRWTALALKLMIELGLTPAPAASLGADVVLIQHYRDEQLGRLQAAGRATLDARDAEEAESLTTR
jgi:hypothetical protein